MNKKIISLALLISMSSLFLTGCNKIEEEKEDMFLAGYIVDVTDNTVEVVSNQGNYKFNIEDASLESEDGINVDDTFEVYYEEELNEEDVTKATKLVEYFDGYFIGYVTDVNEELNEFTLTNEEKISYSFKMPDNINTMVSLLSRDIIYEVEFKQKLESDKINEITALNILEVDETPNEELELIETFTGTMAD